MIRLSANKNPVIATKSGFGKKASIERPRVVIVIRIGAKNIQQTSASLNNA